MKNILYLTAGGVAAFIFIFILQVAGLFNLKFWGVKYKDAHREIFERSKSYNHAMIRDLENLCIEYKKTEEVGHKDAIAATIHYRRSSFKGELPQHVRTCLNSINYRR